MAAQEFQRHVTFVKGDKVYSTENLDPAKRDPLEIVRNDFNELLSSKNLTFLFGSGCSSLRSESGHEQGIPTMAPLAKGILGDQFEEVAPNYGLSVEIRATLKEKLGVDLTDATYVSNLERLMEVLFGFQFALARTENPYLLEAKAALETTIAAIKSYVFKTCVRGQTQKQAGKVLDIYQMFYRKLSQRSSSLPRPTIATTNYDLFNEIAMDRIGVPYINGFLGSVEKRFNPASFRYTIAQQVDLSTQRWSSLDNLVYFLKLHGSLNWRSVDKGLFPVEERPLSESGDGQAMLIYPTPAKQNASFAAPYSDMFREFQSRVVQEQSALVTLGYGFGDEHVNNIIYQALTIPTFRLVILSKPELSGSPSSEHVKMLQDLNDPRIWVIGTEEPDTAWKAHYFKHFVEDIMPSGESDPAEGAIEKVVALMSESGNGRA